jgi:hypothetical protein
MTTGSSIRIHPQQPSKALAVAVSASHHSQACPALPVRAWRALAWCSLGGHGCPRPGSRDDFVASVVPLPGFRTVEASYLIRPAGRAGRPGAPWENLLYGNLQMQSLSLYSGGEQAPCVLPEEQNGSQRVLGVANRDGTPGIGNLDAVATPAAAEAALPPPSARQVDGDAHQLHAAPSR